MISFRTTMKLMITEYLTFQKVSFTTFVPESILNTGTNSNYMTKNIRKNTKKDVGFTKRGCVRVYQTETQGWM